MADAEKPTGNGAPPQKGDWLLKAVYWTVGVLALLVLVGALWVRHVDAEHRRILREARAAVETLRVEPVPDEDNAALLYEKAFTLFSISPRDLGRKLDALENFELDIGSDEIRKLLDDNAAALDALSRAADKPRCVFIIDYSAGMRTKGVSLLEARAAALLLAVAARRAADDGRHGEAVDRVRQALCLARGVGGERLLISHSLSWAMEDLSTTAIRDVLTRTDPGAESLDRLLSVLRDHSMKRPALRDNWHGEMVLELHHCAEVAAGVRPLEISRADYLGKMRYNLRRFSGLVLRDARTAKEIVDYADSRLAQRTRESYWQDCDFAERARINKLYESLDVPYACFPSLRAVLRRDDECTGFLRCARLAVACRLHRLRAGALPAELKELAGFFPDDWAEVSTDPFTGKPLGYKPGTAGFVIWSVGAWPKETATALDEDPYDERHPIFAVDPQLWEAHRAKTIQLRERIKNAPKTPRRPAAAPPNRGAR